MELSDKRELLHYLGLDELAEDDTSFITINTLFGCDAIPYIKVWKDVDADSKNIIVAVARGKDTGYYNAGGKMSIVDALSEVCLKVLREQESKREMNAGK